MAKTVEDILVRRTRAILMDTKSALEIAPEVAKLMAHELGYDDKWQKEQVAQFSEVATQYIIL
jgi:glycerol-3-phosphate dehydrogenase